MDPSTSRFVHYRLDIPHLDEEHLALFKLLHRIRTLDDFDTAYVLLQNAYVAFKEHTAHEEQYMSSVGFPYIAYHSDIHRMLSGAFIDLLMSCSGCKSIESTTHSAVKFLEKLVDHIDHEDMQIGEFVRNKNANKACPLINLKS